MANMSIYCMALLTIPTSVAKKPESIQYKALQGDLAYRKKYHLVARKEVKKPICQEGFGVEIFSGDESDSAKK